MALEQNQRSETLDSFTTLAKEAGISDRIVKAAVKQTVSRAKELWPRALKEMDVPNTVKAEILRRLSTLPLVGAA